MYLKKNDSANMKSNQSITDFRAKKKKKEDDCAVHNSFFISTSMKCLNASSF